MPLSVKWDSGIYSNHTYLIQNFSETNILNESNNTQIFIPLNDINKFEFNKTDADNILKKCLDKNSSSIIYNNYFDIHILIFYIAILSCSAFIQLYFYYKLVIMIIAVIIFIIGFHIQTINHGLNNLIENTAGFNAEIIIKLIFYVLFLHMVNRRV